MVYNTILTNLKGHTVLRNHNHRILGTKVDCFIYNVEGANALSESVLHSLFRVEHPVPIRLI